MVFRIIAIFSFVAGVQSYPAIGAYMPVSSVLEHSQINLDVKKFVEALGESPVNYAKATEIYVNGGGHSCKNANTPRTLKAFAEKDLAGESFADAFYSSDGMGLHTDWWHDWFKDGLGGCGWAATISEKKRKVSLMKGAMGLLTWYAAHELEAAIDKAKTEAKRADTVAPHAWDEGWAFYYGTNGEDAPWEVAKKRDSDFCEGNPPPAGCATVKTDIVPHFNKGLLAVRTATYSETTAIKHRDYIYAMWTITYMRAALKYLSITEHLYNEKAHAEGYAYWMAIAGWVAKKCKTDAQAMTAAVDITQTSIPSGTYCTVKTKMESCYSALGISCELMGVFKTAGTGSVSCPTACSSTAVTIDAGVAAVTAVTGTNTDVTCTPTAAAPGMYVCPAASNAVISTVGIATLGLSGLLHM